MKRMMAIAMFVAVAGSMAAMAMTTTERPAQVDEAQVQAQIDSRLHDLLVQMREQRYGK